MMSSYKPHEEQSGGSMWLTYQVAADRLGVRKDTLKMAGLAKRVSVKDGRISEEEVEKWLKVFWRLNDGFGWLLPSAKQFPSNIRTSDAKSTMQILGCSPTTLRLWSKDGLLPYFVRSFTSGTFERRAYVSSYIVGLYQFAGEDKIVTKLAQDYYRLCSVNKRVM